jgi:hypothetical protein
MALTHSKKAITRLLEISRSSISTSSQVLASQKSPPTDTQPLHRITSPRAPHPVIRPPPLHDSLSGAHYPIPQSYAPSSISDPEFFLQNSMSDSMYDLPPHLASRQSSRQVLSSGNASKRHQGSGQASLASRPTMQRIVAGTRSAADKDISRLQNSFSHGDYS